MLKSVLVSCVLALSLGACVAGEEESLSQPDLVIENLPSCNGGVWFAYDEFGVGVWVIPTFWAPGSAAEVTRSGEIHTFGNVWVRTVTTNGVAVAESDWQNITINGGPITVDKRYGAVLWAEFAFEIFNQAYQCRIGSGSEFI